LLFGFCLVGVVLADSKDDSKDDESSEDGSISKDSSSDKDEDDDDEEDCVYAVNDFYYDFSDLEGIVYKYMDENNSTWYWSICGDLSSVATTGCSPNSAVCVVKGTNAISYGNASTAALLEQSEDAEDDISIMFSNGDQCDVQSRRTVTLHMTCDEEAEEPVVTSSTQSLCTASLNISSSAACPDSIDDGDHEAIELIVIIVPVVGGVAIILTAVLIFVCCRRMKRRRQALSVAHVPLLQDQETPRHQHQPIHSHLPYPVPVQQMPAFYPMNGQIQVPQQFVLYPPIQSQMQQVVAPVTTGDERLARELQSQFDKERNN